MTAPLSTPKRWRFLVVIVCFLLALFLLLGRLLYLNVLDQNFLVKQSRSRVLRKDTIPASRGMITDRQGYPLAVSTPVGTICANPRIFSATSKQLKQLADLLGESVKTIRHRIQSAKDHYFVFIKRLIPPPIAAQIKALGIKGLFLRKEYKRYYPTGEVSSQLIGLTNVDDEGQSGLELAYNHWLMGDVGKKEVLKDRLGRTIENIAVIKKPHQGHVLKLSINHRIQYLAYRALKRAVQRNHATSGSIVVLKVKTGEVLAMVDQPSCNPNRRPPDKNGCYRNRAVTDMFEPGSTIKPFTIALALESGQYTPDSTVDTNPGKMTIGGYEIEDDGLNYGVINLTQVLEKSSNIGAAKIMLSLNPQKYYLLLREFGFGERTRSGFPGEASGVLLPRSVWYPSVVAALAYGYGVSVTALQLAHAYGILADGGIKVPVTFLQKKEPPKGVRILPEKVASSVVKMLKSVVTKAGTGYRARVPGYTVAGKTGTAYIDGPHGYYKDRFMASFVGMAPVPDPRLVVAVVIRRPRGKHWHSGGLVSAPVFSKVMGGALRILDIPPGA